MGPMVIMARAGLWNGRGKEGRKGNTDAEAGSEGESSTLSMT